MANEVTEKDLEKIQSDNEKLQDQIAEEERKLSEATAAASIKNDKKLLESENDRLKAKLADIRAQVKIQQNAKSPAELAADSGQRYEDLVSVDGDSPQAAAPEVAAEEKKAGN